MSRLVENSGTSLLAQYKIISYIEDSMEIIIYGDIFTFQCSVEYNTDIEEIKYTLREKFFNISFTKTLGFDQIFRKSIKYTPSLSNEKIQLYRPNIHFIFLILKNIACMKHSCELYKITNSDIILPNITDSFLIQSLLSNMIIKHEPNFLNADLLIIYVHYKKYNFIYDLKKINL
jgi:hypothetical protein